MYRNEYEECRYVFWNNWFLSVQGSSKIFFLGGRRIMDSIKEAYDTFIHMLPSVVLHCKNYFIHLNTINSI